MLFCRNCHGLEVMFKVKNRENKKIYKFELEKLILYIFELF